MATVQ